MACTTSCICKTCEISNVFIQFKNAVIEFYDKLSNCKEEYIKIVKKTEEFHSSTFDTKYTDIEKLRFVVNFKKDLFEYNLFLSEILKEFDTYSESAKYTITKFNLKGTFIDSYISEHSENIIIIIGVGIAKITAITLPKIDLYIKNYRDLDSSINDEFPYINATMTFYCENDLYKCT
jgi:hypothetical protein